MADAVSSAEFDQIIIGGNLFANCKGLISIEGQEQVVLEVDDKNTLLVTIDLLDESGTMIGKFRRNAWAFHDDQRFDVSTNPESLSMTDRDSQKVVFEASLTGNNSLEITAMDLYGPDGIHVRVRKMMNPLDNLQPPISGMTINGSTVVGNQLVGTSGIRITKNGFSM